MGADRCHSGTERTCRVGFAKRFHSCLMGGVRAFFPSASRQGRPSVVAVLVGAGERGVFAVECKWPIAPEGVVVAIDATIVEEPGETVPAWKSVAYRLAKAALGANPPFARFDEPVEVIDDRPAALVAGVPVLVGG